jgi:mannosyltransferase
VTSTLTVVLPRRSTRSIASVLALAARPEFVLGILSSIVCFAGSWIPSYWGDEAASVLSAQRSIPSLMNELSAVDAVHGLYYFGLHIWIDAFGASEISTRFPSAIAAGFAVAGTVMLGRRLWGRRVAWLAGIAAVAVPALTNLGMEARSYAFSMAITVWITVYVLRLRRTGGSVRGWIGYAVAIGASSYLFLFLILLVPLHAAVLLALRARGRTWLRWGIASAGAILLMLPMLHAAYDQKKQIKFLEDRDYANWANVFVNQWFDQRWAAAVGWSLVIVGLLWVLTRPGLRRIALGRRWLATAALAFGVTAMLLVGNLFTPLYNLRYTSSAVPALAVLVGLGAMAVGRMVHGRGRIVLSTVAIAGFLGSAALSYIDQRTPYGKHDSDLRQVADVMGAVSHAGDAVIFDDSVLAHEKPRLAMRLYPAAFRHLDDVELETPYYDRAAIWDAVSPQSELAQRVAGHRIVWAVEALGGKQPDVAALEAAGYEAVAWYPIHQNEVIQFVSLSG